MFLKLITFTLLLSMLVRTSLASPPSLTYQGRIIKSDGTPLEYSNVSFSFKITDPTGQCILYQEQVNAIDMTNSSGVFDVPIGQGSVVYISASASTLLDVFSNSLVFICSGGTPYTPVNTDGRLLRVSFHDGVGWNAITPDNKIRSVPYAAYALSAQKLGDKVANDFLAKAGLPVCGAGTFLTWNGTALTCEAAGGGGGGTVTSVSTGTGLTGGPITTTGTISLANTAVTPGSYTKANITVDAQGRLTSASNGGVLNLASEVTGVLPIANGGTNSSTALTNNRVMASIGGAIVESAAITANKALVSDANGLPTHSSVSNTELNYLSGVTSGIQNQIDSKTSASGWANYSVMGTNGAGNLVAIPGATTNTMLQWSLTGPVWSAASYPSSTTSNQLLYSSGNNVVAGLPTANNAVLMTNGSGVPSWSVISNDSFTQYVLVAGRSGGQTLNGGTAASENLVLDSTANSIKGNIILNPSAGSVGIGMTNPASVLDVRSNNSATVGTKNGVNIQTYASAPSNGSAFFTGMNSSVSTSGSFNIGGATGAIGYATHSASGTAGSITGVSGTVENYGGTVVDLVGGSFSTYSSGANLANNTYGVHGHGYRQQVGTVNKVVGGYFTSVKDGGDATDLIGVDVKTSSELGTATNIYGIRTSATHWTSAVGQTATNMYGHRITLSQSGTGVVTNFYGLYIDPFNLAAPGTLRYGIYQEGASEDNYFAGNVGIGLTSPVAKLNVAGAMVSVPSDVPSGAVVDLSLSNTITLAAVGGTEITLNNMVHGGTYTLVIQDTTARTYTFTGCNTSKFKPANASTTAGTHSIYTILTVSNSVNYDCYITWATGYQ